MNAPANDPRTRVVFVNRFFWPDESATSQMLTDLARGLAARGFDIHVICSSQLYEASNARLDRFEMVHGVAVHRVFTTRFGRRNLAGRALDYISFYVTCLVEALRLVGKADVLVAKTDPPLVSVVCGVAAKLKGGILVNWQQDVFPEIAAHLGGARLPRWADGSLRRIRNASMRAARMNVLIGTRMGEYFAGVGIPAARTTVIENWADADAVVPKPPAASDLRAKLGLLEHFVVGYSGNLGRAHEFDTLLGAAEILEDDPGIAFLIIGGGAKMPGLMKSVADRGLKNFRFLPYQPRSSLADSLAAADVHIASLLPALEGLIVPSKFYGILAAGRPVVFVGDRDGELARVIAASHCGVAVSVAAPAELAAQLRRLRAAPDFREAMGRRARELLTGRYASARGIDAWVKVLRPFTKPRKSGPRLID